MSILAYPVIYAHSTYNQYVISGKVDQLGEVGFFAVYLFDRASLKLSARTFSNIAGEYTFSNVPYKERGYFVVACSPIGLNAAIADHITPELV